MWRTIKADVLELVQISSQHVIIQCFDMHSYALTEVGLIHLLNEKKKKILIQL